MGDHLTQLRQNAIYVLISINESDDNRKVTASPLNEMSCTHLASAKESSNGMKHHCSRYTLFAQVLENFQVQGTVMPRITICEVHCYLYGHKDCHSTTTVPALHLPARRQDKESCWR